MALHLIVSPSKLSDGYRIRPQSLEGSLRAYLAEAAGTFLFAFVSAAAVCADGVFGLGPAAVALAQGLALTVLMMTLRPVSGGQFNPALTLATMAARRQPALHGCLYLLAQLVGGAAAGGALRLLFGRFDIVSAPPFLGAPHPALELGTLEVAGLEGLLTFLLVCSIFATEIDPRGKKQYAPIAAGGTIALSSLWAAPLTGAFLNPVRALAPSLGAWHWSAHEAYWIGPLLGGLAAAAFYEYVLLRPMGVSKI